MNNLKELMEKSVNVKKKYIEWMKGNLKKWQKEQAPHGASPTDFPDVTDSMAEKFAMNCLIANPHTLATFFDEEHLYVFAYRFQDKWMVEVDSLPLDEEYKTRIEAEIEGFKEAIKIMERNAITVQG